MGEMLTYIFSSLRSSEKRLLLKVLKMQTKLMPLMLFGDSLIVTTNGMARVVYSQSSIADMT